MVVSACLLPFYRNWPKVFNNRQLPFLSKKKKSTCIQQMMMRFYALYLFPQNSINFFVSFLFFHLYNKSFSWYIFSSFLFRCCWLNKKIYMPESLFSFVIETRRYVLTINKALKNYNSNYCLLHKVYYTTTWCPYCGHQLCKFLFFIFR